MEWKDGEGWKQIPDNDDVRDASKTLIANVIRPTTMSAALEGETLTNNNIILSTQHLVEPPPYTDFHIFSF